MIPPPRAGTSTNDALFDDDDEEGWQEMPVIRDDFANGLDDEDRKKFHYVTPQKHDPVNATGNLIDFDGEGHEWREKTLSKESEYSEYTRLRLNEEDDNDEVHLRTKFLFDEDKAMTPLSQMQATKNMLTEAQRIAYVGLCALVSKEIASDLRRVKSKELKPALDALELWSLKIMGRLYYHMELETQEQKMIDSLAEHGVQAADLAPALMTTHTVSNPEYDPAEGRKRELEKMKTDEEMTLVNESLAEDIADISSTPKTPTTPTPKTPSSSSAPYQTTANILPPSVQEPMPGVSTSLSSADKDVTLDIRWTVLCDLFLVLIADSVYDSRSRVLLEQVAYKLGLGWLDVVKFEQRVSEALEIQEGAETLEQKDIIEGRVKAAKKKRIAMLGLATLGGGLVIGLSAGILAPVIGAGIAGAFTTLGVTGTGAFLAGTGGAAVITTAGTLTGSTIGLRGMARRTQNVQIFDLLPMHNNKRVNCILTVSGFMNSVKDDVRLPFSVLDPVVGDVFSVLWEPEMLGETGATLKILTSEVLSQVSTTVLSATVMTSLMAALQWPILLTKLGYLIDNPWSNALDRARAAGLVLADVLIRRHLGVRPITLIGFSLGARVIFYCLLELAKHKAYGIVQDVFILGATLTASKANWYLARSVVAGRFVNGYARNDWVLNYLFRATSGGLQNIAGLRPVNDVPGLENVDVTDKIAGHASYRTFMPLILDQLGFPVSADYFDEPEEPDMKEDRMVVREGEDVPKKKSWFTRRDSKRKEKPSNKPPGPDSRRKSTTSAKQSLDDNELPERLEHAKTPTSAADMPSSTPSSVQSPPSTPRPSDVSADDQNDIPVHAGFDLRAIKEVIANANTETELHAPQALTPHTISMPSPHIPSGRAESVPPPVYAKESDQSSDLSRTDIHPGYSRSRVTSTPMLSSEGSFGEDEDDGDITSALGSSSKFVGPPNTRDLANSFSQSMSLQDQSRTNYSSTYVLKSGLSDNDSLPSNSRSGETGYSAWSSTDRFASGLGPGMNIGGFSDPYTGSRLGPTNAPTLTFGGAGGSLWDSTSSMGMQSSLESNTNPYSSRRTDGSQSTLPADILNPFAMSSVGLNTIQKKEEDAWSPPPLPKKSKSGDNSSVLNISSNPWE